MSRWDLAEWVGPTPNRYINGRIEVRGVILHTMQGSYAGSIAWGKNPASQVSFEFATRRDGHIGQLVDTADAAWTQGAGNGHWYAIENEGESGTPLTPAQVEACAQIYAETVRRHPHVPLTATDSPDGYGLGWHGMGGVPWGNHPNCPGQPIIDQRGAILARAGAILNGEDIVTPDDINAIVDALLGRELDTYTLDANGTAQATGRASVAAILSYGHCAVWNTSNALTVSDPDRKPAPPLRPLPGLGSGGTVAQHTHIPGAVQ